MLFKKIMAKIKQALGYHSPGEVYEFAFMDFSSLARPVPSFNVGDTIRVKSEIHGVDEEYRIEALTDEETYQLQRIKEVLQEAGDRDMGILVVTHNLELAKRICTRIYDLSTGEYR